ncbi:MAG TPA: glycosyltransferase [Vicinamibacterales bacterium]|nr:glycosyltransferase [Vicinamibacterales bacterium]
MRILWLKADLLLPLDKGGKLRTWHLLRHLARRHDVTYLAFAAPDEPQAHIDGMREVARAVHVVPRVDPPKRSVRFYADAARHMANPLPYAIGKYRSRAFAARVEQLLAEQPFDLVVSDFIVPAVNLPARLPCPALVFTHNVEAEIWRRHAATSTGPVARYLYGVQHRRMLRFEGQALARFDGVLAVSEADRDTLGRLYPGALRSPAHVVPTGVDTSFFDASAVPADGPALVFTGSMDWLPNEDAMRWFCRDVLPRIRADVPGTTLTIVGRAPTPAVRRLAEEPGVTVTGRVDDVRPYMAAGAAYVVPLRIGGGTRLKIFEAMAMGKAVVSTTVGAEGLPVRSGEHLLVADDADAFASAVVRLLRHPEERQALGAAARAFVVAGYDWEVVAAELETALTRVAHAGTSRASTARARRPAEPVAAAGRPATSVNPRRLASRIPIAVWLSSFDAGGTERQMVRLIRGLDPAVFEVHAACFRAEGPWLAEAAACAASIAEFPIHGFRSRESWRQVVAFARWCRAREITAVVTSDFYTNVLGLAGAALARVPIRLAGRREINTDKTIAKLILQRAAYALAHRVVANADAGAARLRREGVRRSRIRVVPNEIEVPDGPARSPRPIARVLTVANLRAEKGHDVLIDAVARVSRATVAFDLAGDGPCRSALEARARARGVADRVRFLGHRDDVPQLLAQADAFVLPSRTEAFPNGLVEAMAAGLPVIASGVGGISELVEDGVTGLLVPPGDPGALAAAVDRLAADPQAAWAMGAAARRLVVERYAAPRMVSGFADILRAELAVRTRAVQRPTSDLVLCTAAGQPGSGHAKNKI